MHIFFPSLISSFLSHENDSASNLTDSVNHKVSEALAECLGLVNGARFRVRARSDVAEAETIVVEPATEDDWEILELNAEYLEDHILSEVRVRIPLQKSLSVTSCRFHIGIILLKDLKKGYISP